MDFQRSFSYVFEDPSWLQKILIGSLVSLIPVINFAAIGFALETMRRAKDGVVPVMPEWQDFADFFKEGLQLFLGLLGYFVILFLLFGAAGGFAFVGSVSRRFGVQPSFSGFALVIFMVSMVYLLALTFFYPAIYLNFGRKRTISAVYELKEIMRVFLSDPGRYFLCWINIVLAYLMVIIAAAIPGIGSIISIFIGFYANLVVSGAVAQLWIALYPPLDVDEQKV